MKFEEFNHEEIEEIAEEFEAGVIIPADIKKWYEYKESLIQCIEDGKYWEEKAEEDKADEVLRKILQKINTAKNELKWMRIIHTYDLHKVCEYIVNTVEEYAPTVRGVKYWNFPKMTVHMAKKVLDGCSETEEQFIREMFEESEIIKKINLVRQLTRPVNERTGKWSRMWNRKTEYSPYETATDGTRLYDHNEHYVYIESKCTEHRWGETYWISIDCDNELYSLPIIKDFKNYDFEIGGFYKIKCTDEIRFGNNKKKYVMDIQQSSEEEFMEKGFKMYCIR